MPFQKGQTGNAGGRPTRYNQAQSLAREHAEAAVKKLVEVMERGTLGEARRAACDLLDRGFGKPKEFHEMTGEDGAPIASATVLTGEQLLALIRQAEQDV